MNEILMIAFTAVIAISTVIYTIVTFRLWKAHRDHSMSRGPLC